MTKFRTRKSIPNLNGTSLDELKEQQRKVHEECASLAQALRAAYPHGRDYQLNEGGSPANPGYDYKGDCELSEVMLEAVEAIRTASHNEWVRLDGFTRRKS